MLPLVSDPTFVTERALALETPGGRTLLLVALVGATVAFGASWLGVRRLRNPRIRRMLLTLRATALIAALLMLKPVVHVHKVALVPTTIAVLVDDSRSMALPGTDEKTTRAQAAARLLRESDETLRALAQTHRLDYYTFGETLKPVSEQAVRAGITPSGIFTRVGEALQAVRSRYTGRDLAGIILISDGADNGRFGPDGLDALGVSFVRSLDAPVHTLLLGGTSLRDVSVVGVRADEFAFVKIPFTLEAVLRIDGYKERPFTVLLKQDGKTIATQSVTPTADAVTLTVPFEVRPSRVGRFLYTVEVPPLEGEVLHVNNAARVVLDVIRDRVRVLHVAGRPSYDERFLRALLKNDPNVELISFFILRTPADLTLVPDEELSLIPFPTEELFEQELHTFDVVILQNFEYGPYGLGPHLGRIRQFVEEGGALAMVGGDSAFCSGGYRGTPIADILPVRLDACSLDPTRLVSTEPFSPTLTPAGKTHPILALFLDVGENAARLRQLPELEGVNAVGPPRPGATLLLAHPTLTTADGQPMPVLAVADIGKGRSLALTTDSLWHWGFVAAGEKGAARAAGDDWRTYARFWGNAIRWLIHDPMFRYLRVEPERTRYQEGEHVHVTAEVAEQSHEPARDIPVHIEIHLVETVPAFPPPAQAVAPSAPRLGPVFSAASRTDAEGKIRLDFAPPAPGAYRVTAHATLRGRALTDESLFVVSPSGHEFAITAARPATLRAIAQASSGTFLANPRRLPGLRVHPPRLTKVAVERVVPLWNRWLSVILILGCLTVEWILRRRAGLP